MSFKESARVVAAGLQMTGTKSPVQLEPLREHLSEQRTPVQLDPFILEQWSWCSQLSRMSRESRRCGPYQYVGFVPAL